ncbi:MAG: glycoside hydrolase family 78 protein [Eubacterium sp.]|nr:glycoside hydrolase family 78 protein [Eubacterium sp.]
MLKIQGIKINHLTKPKGIKGDIRAGWEICSDRTGVSQSGYQLQISEQPDFGEVLYDSGKMESAESANVIVKDFCWKSLTRYFLRVRIWDHYGEESAWNGTEFLSALQDAGEWRAVFITAESNEDKKEAPGTAVRKEFHVQKPVREAFLVSTAHGLYQAFINGKRIGCDELTPGWTSYKKRLLYQSYDITGMLRQGGNAIGVLLGAGWYKGDISYQRSHNFYGDFAAFAGQIVIRYEDGSEEAIPTDADWKGAYSAVTHADLFDGESYDARLEQCGWKEPGFDESGWSGVRVVKQTGETLIPQQGCTVRVKEKKAVKDLIVTPQGDTVLDFGQNLAGWVHFRVKGKRGDVVELNCFEILDAQGNVYTENLRTAKQTIRYICRGDEEEEFTPHFTYQGFRYARVKQYPGVVEKDNFEALVLYSDMEQIGTFRCSNPLLNQLQSNICWGMKGNSVDIPTDCPQRDERLGWTGDAQIFGQTAGYLMDTTEFYRKWLCDVAADQKPDGGVPNVVPDVLPDFEGKSAYGASAWGDVAVILPWHIYQETGDVSIILQQYESMKAWVDFLTKNAQSEKEIFEMQFGDWVALDAEEGSYHGATPDKLACFAYYAYVSGIFAKMAKAAGNTKDAKTYQVVHEKAKGRFQERYFREDGTMTVQTQTAHIVALFFDLVPENGIDTVVQGLLKLLNKYDGHLTTGFIGTPYFLHALSRNGCLKEAYELLLKEDFPSWLYQVKQGATTVWEHWDGLKPDGSMWSADMNSFNHYAYGAVGQWLYEVCAGLRMDERHPGWKHFYVEPHPGGGLTFAEAAHRTVYGQIRVKWELRDDEMLCQVKIPHNTSADIILHQASEIRDDASLAFVRDGGMACAKAGSGAYEIRVKRMR